MNMKYRSILQQLSTVCHKFLHPLATGEKDLIQELPGILSACIIYYGVTTADPR